MNFVVAFLAEAQPVIEFYHLEKIATPKGIVFQNDQHSLIIGGLGREKAFDSTQLLAQIQGEKNMGWLNLGIAGHGSLHMGELFMAGKIIDDASDEAFYPPQIYDHSFPISTLCTSTKPVNQYEHRTGYDMEAHAFYEAASDWSTRELIQVVKVISDTPSHPVEKIKPKEATRLIEAKMMELDPLITQIDHLSHELRPDEEVQTLCNQIEKLHAFSITRTYQLKNLIRHAKLLKLDMKKIDELVQSSTNGKEALEQIRNYLEPNRKLG